MIIKEIDPSRCKPWAFHNRDKAWLTQDLCQDLISSIEKYGQIEPALVREIKGDPDYDFEIIFGVRRWFACSQIPQKKLFAQVTNADDKTCALLMHTENADSKDISEFERAFSFLQQMKAGIFKTQLEIANAMELTQGYVSKLIRAGKIFEVPWIESLLKTKMNVSIKYAYALSVLLKNAPTYDLIKEEADVILSEEEKGKALTPTLKLKRLIIATKRQTSFFRTTLLNMDSKPIISCAQNKAGHFSLFIDPKAKDLEFEKVQEACLTAIANFILR